MKIITNASYYGSGSSVITDLLGEYQGVKTLDSNFECRIAYDMFGLSDLEYYLVENNHRHNSSVAINMFRRLCGIYGLNKYIRLENYPGFFGEIFSKSVQEYIDKLVVDTFHGGAHTDIYMKSNLEIFIVKLKDFIYNKFHRYKLTVDDATWASKGITPYERELNNCTYNITYPRESFLQDTRDFTKSLFEGVDGKDMDFLMVEQLVPPSNTMRYIRYFEDLKVISVDRDPRDIFYNEKKYWHGGVAPTDAYKFVEWFKATRAHLQYENDDASLVKRMKFENLVFNYDTSVVEIEKFLHLDPAKHINKKTKFIPELSIKNIARWKEDTSFSNDISIIENNLEKYLSY